MKRERVKFSILFEFNVYNVYSFETNEKAYEDFHNPCHFGIKTKQKKQRKITKVNTE